MTREDAIKILKELPNSILCVVLPFDTDFDYTQALDMAIKALEQEPCEDVFMNKPCISSGVCEHDKMEVLDKIRAEIEEIVGERGLDDYDFCSGLIRARNIIDKYRAEMEIKNDTKRTEDEIETLRQLRLRKGIFRTR